MANQQCQNCGSAITCGCQKRVASDGTKVCNNCIQLYEKALKEQKQKTEEDA
jgi:hypothetical protein